MISKEFIDDLKEKLSPKFYDDELDAISLALQGISDKYDVRRAEVHSCSECFHYHTLKPGEFTYIGPAPKIEECRKGHIPGKYVADYCRDFLDINGGIKNERSVFMGIWKNNR